MPALLASRDGTPHCSSSATACVAAFADAGNVEPRLRELERERHFGAHEHERPQLASARTWSARKIIGGIPTPPPSASSRGRVGSTVKPWPIGASTLTTSPGCRVAEHVEPVALRLVQELEPTFGRARAHDRQRPAHRHRRIARDVRERAGRCFARRARRLDAQHELLPRPGALREDPRILEEYAAAIPLVTHCRSLTAGSSIAPRSGTPRRGRRRPCRRGGEDTRIGGSPRAPTPRPPRSASRRRSRRAARSARPRPRRKRARCRATASVPSPSGTPTTSCAGRQSSMMRSRSCQGGSRFGAQRRQRRRRASCAVRGRDSYTTKPEVERDEDVAAR